MWVELIGWGGAVVLLLTLGRQVYTQWRDGRAQGVSRWLFVGQLTASTAFLVYSWLLHNWVFVVTNALLLVTAAVGEWIYLRNRKLEDAATLAADGQGRHSDNELLGYARQIAELANEAATIAGAVAAALVPGKSERTP